MTASRSEAQHTPGALALSEHLHAEHTLRHAIRYALTAIDEHLAGARIDWHDVRDVLKRAIGETAGQ